MASPQTSAVVFDLALVALIDAADRPGMAPARIVPPLEPALGSATKTARIKAFLGEGKTVAEVAGIVGVSKAHVYEVRARIQRPVVAPAAEPAPSAAPVQPPPVTVALAPIPQAVPPVARIDGRTARRKPIRPGIIAGPAKACQWIEGDPTPDDSCKCLAPSMPGISYCRTHARRAFRAPGAPADFPVLSPIP